MNVYQLTRSQFFEGLVNSRLLVEFGTWQPWWVDSWVSTSELVAHFEIWYPGHVHGGQSLKFLYCLCSCSSESRYVCHGWFLQVLTQFNRTCALDFKGCIAHWMKKSHAYDVFGTCKPLKQCGLAFCRLLWHLSCAQENYVPRGTRKCASRHLWCGVVGGGGRLMCRIHASALFL